MLVTLAEIRDAAERLRGVAVRTPLVAFPAAGESAWLKPESLQPVGAFKIRGAFVAISRLSDEARRRGLYSLEAGSLGVLARIAARRGEVDEARGLLRRASGIQPELPDLLMLGNDVLSRATVELAAGDLDRAGQVLAQGLEEAERGIVSSPSQIAHVAALLGRIRLLQDREADAEQAVELARRASVASEAGAQVRWRQVRALLLARRGRFDEARALARQALDGSRRTQSPDIQAEALAGLAEVLHRAGDRGGAARAAERALALYEHRGDRVHERQVTEFLNGL